MVKALLLTGSVFWANFAAAYGPCDQDIEKLCDEKFHGETSRTCLHSQVEKLTPECKAFVESRNAEWKKDTASLGKVKEACAKETEKHCPEAKDSRKTFVVCIMAHSDAISDTCKKEINRHISEHMPNIKPL